MGYNLLRHGIYWNYNPLILTSWDLQVGLQSLKKSVPTSENLPNRILMKLCLVLNPYPIAHFTPPFISIIGAHLVGTAHMSHEKTLLLSDKHLLTFHYSGCCLIGILDVHQRGVGFTSSESSESRAHGPHGKSCIFRWSNTRKGHGQSLSRRCSAWIPGLPNSWSKGLTSPHHTAASSQEMAAAAWWRCGCTCTDFFRLVTSNLYGLKSIPKSPS